jgi:hypothetical protein
MGARAMRVGGPRQREPEPIPAHRCTGRVGHQQAGVRMTRNTALNFVAALMVAAFANTSRKCQML